MSSPKTTKTTATIITKATITTTSTPLRTCMICKTPLEGKTQKYCKSEFCSKKRVNMRTQNSRKTKKTKNNIIQQYGETKGRELFEKQQYIEELLNKEISPEEWKKINDFQQRKRERDMQKQQSLISVDKIIEHFNEENKLECMSIKDKEIFMNMLETIKNHSNKVKQDKEKKMLEDHFRAWSLLTNENKELRIFREKHPKISHFIDQIIPEPDRTEMMQYLLDEGWSQSLDCIFIPAVIAGIFQNDNVDTTVFSYMFYRNKDTELPFEKKCDILTEDITDEEEIQKIRTGDINLLWNDSMLRSRIRYDDTSVAFYKNNRDKKRRGNQICRRISDLLNDTIQIIRCSIDNKKPYILSQMVSKKFVSYGEPYDRVIQYAKDIVAICIPQHRWESMTRLE